MPRFFGFDFSASNFNYLYSIVGVRIFKECIEVMEYQISENRIYCDVDSNIVSESFKSTDYSPRYNVGSNGCRCDCSRYLCYGVCRHEIFYRFSLHQLNNTPIFTPHMVKPRLLQIKYRINEEDAESLEPVER